MPEKISSYLTSAIAHPDRTLIEGIRHYEPETQIMTIFDTRHTAWNTGANARSHKFDEWNPKTITVLATTLDAYCGGNKLTPDALILDLENGEMDALFGVENIIRSALCTHSHFCTFYD